MEFEKLGDRAWNVKIGTKAEVISAALPIYTEILQELLDTAEGSLYTRDSEGCIHIDDDDDFEKVWAALHTDAVARIAELLGVGVADIVAPRNAGHFYILLACQITLLALAKIENVRPEFREAITRRVTERHGDAITVGYADAFELPEGTLLSDFDPDEWAEVGWVHPDHEED